MVGVAYPLSGPIVIANALASVPGVVGEKIGILGGDLFDATQVTFTDTSASFKVRTKTLILTEVPSGATTGNVQVKLPGGTLSSNVQFQVLK